VRRYKRRPANSSQMPNVPTAAETETALRARYGRRFHLLEGGDSDTPSALFNESIFARNWKIVDDTYAIGPNDRNDDCNDLICAVKPLTDRNDDGVSCVKMFFEDVKDHIIDRLIGDEYCEPFYKRIKANPKIRQYLDDLASSDKSIYDVYCNDWSIILNNCRGEGATDGGFWLINLNPASALYEHVIVYGGHWDWPQMLQLADIVGDIERHVLHLYEKGVPVGVPEAYAY
jgi:hypothetical protein